MTENEAIDLLAKLRTSWRADFADSEHVAWRTELVLVTHDAAEATIDALRLQSPHQRPTLVQFIDELHARAMRLSPRQIQTNLAGIEHVRNQLARNRQDKAS